MGRSNLGDIAAVPDTKEFADTSREARRMIVNAIRKNLVGPERPDEVITEMARVRYHTGFLSPVQTTLDLEEDDQEITEEEPDSGPSESILTLTGCRRQSAMGMTFQVDDVSVPVTAKITWASYSLLPQSPDGCKLCLAKRGIACTDGHHRTGKATATKEDHSSTYTIKCWERIPHDICLSVQPPEKAGRHSSLLYKEDGISVHALSNIRNGVRTITVSIVNGKKDPGSDVDVDNCIYQVGISVCAQDNRAAFIAPMPDVQIEDEEFWTFELLYRRARQFAVGHGCSVSWSSLDGRRASEIWTDWIPEAEVLKASAEVSCDTILDLDGFTDVSRQEEVCGALEKLPRAYEHWICKCECDVDAIVNEFAPAYRDYIRKSCSDQLHKCRATLGRIREGITVLRTDRLAWKSFCLANRAMALSMRQKRPDTVPRWRPFQIAFILISFPSSIDARHPFRKSLDLMWFPTGGGKTEAYLGLAALCIFHRRLVHKGSEYSCGTAVITRYTLRLLTIQQFERTARMVCACELVRRSEKKSLGDSPVTLGLFVGGPATPNTRDEAKKILLGDAEDDAVTTLPVRACPWCNTSLTVSDQHFDNDQLITCCPNPACAFNSKLPLSVVDECIYDNPPTIVIGTIDKFARMAWEPRIRSLFGKGPTAHCPPSLIIQDELHLITNALGTMAALYETVVDHLCSIDGAVPKLVGSTATIRRAEEQCKGLFARSAVQFPPSGLDASDSFFYREDDLHPGRLYVGVHAQGRSPKQSLVWLIAVLSQMAANIPNPMVRDIYHTLVVYFNSLRELGGALVLAEDTVPRHMEAMFAIPREDIRTLAQVQELTSALPSSQVGDMLKALEVTVFAENLEAEPIDLLLATNMISVGVDIDRLGVMLVNGQPKTTAEYIQASSRVGRPADSAGLVVVLYNWARARDRSHYERFLSYHKAFYRHVEFTNTTPFAARARDRALHAVLVSLVRLVLEDFASNSSAQQIATRPDLREEVSSLADIILERTRQIDPAEVEETREHLQWIIDEWAELAADSNQTLHWSMRRTGQQRAGLLRMPDKRDDYYGIWPTPNSMRDVESPAPIRLLTRREIDRLERS